MLSYFLLKKYHFLYDYLGGLTIVWKKVATMFSISQIVIILLVLIRTNSIPLIDYINVSFLIGGLFFFIALSIFLMSSGFLDLTVYGFRRVFSVNGRTLSKEEVEEMRKLSELVTVNYLPFLLTGILILFVIIGALYFYYN
jgi:Zn-dependent protease with chaperone function